MVDGTDGASRLPAAQEPASIDCINCNGIGYIYDACDGQRSKCLTCGGSGSLYTLPPVKPSGPKGSAEGAAVPNHQEEQGNG